MCQSRISPAALALALVLSLASAGCASTGDEPKGEPYYGDLLVERQREPIGLFLTDIDASVRAWNNLVLTATDGKEQRRAAMLQEDLRYKTQKRYPELIEQLETGPPANRVVAAVAVGFSNRDSALSPLLAALDDPENRVRSNALLGLALLKRSETPLGGIAEFLRDEPEPQARTNAAFALREIAMAGAPVDSDVIESVRAGLLDTEPMVRSQCSLLLAYVGDAEAVDTLELLVYDEVPIVSRAAAKALAYLGYKDPYIKGSCARALAGALERLEGPARQGVLTALRELAEANYGQDPEDWIDWAHRLP